jgi:hypothetical protein
VPCVKSQFYSRTKHLLLSAYGSRWRKVHLAMFTVHIDDSGTDPNQPVAIATALIVPAARIVSLDREWKALTEKEGFPDFHMSECVASNKDSHFAHWGDDKKRRVISRVRQIGKKFGSQAISLAVHKADYDEVVPDELREFSGRFHYTWAIRNMIGQLDKWAKFKNVTLPFEYIYDWMDPKAQREAKAEIDTVMAQAEHLAAQAGLAGRYTNYSFRRRQDIPALQCNDALAWTCYQYAQLAHLQTPLSDIAKDCWDDYFNHPGDEWLYAATMTRAQLEDWVRREQEQGLPDFDRFRDWYAQHPKPKRKKSR